MKTEIYIPFLYSIRREQRRFKLSWKASTIRFFSGMIRTYLWIPLYALLILNLFQETYVYIHLVIYFIAFILIYETGYIVTDNIGITIEKKHLRKIVYKEKINSKTLWAGVLIRLLLFIILYMIFKELFYTKILIFYLLTLLIFFVHSFLTEKYRPATFFGLRMLKGLVPYSFLIIILSLQDILLILSGVIGTSLYFSMEYTSRKLEYKSNIDFFNERNSFQRFMLIFIISSGFTLFFNILLYKFLVFLAIIALHHLIITFLTRVKRKVIR